VAPRNHVLYQIVSDPLQTFCGRSVAKYSRRRPIQTNLSWETSTDPLSTENYRKIRRCVRTKVPLMFCAASALRAVANCVYCNLQSDCYTGGL